MELSVNLALIILCNYCVWWELEDISVLEFLYCNYTFQAYILQEEYYAVLVILFHFNKII